MMLNCQGRHSWLFGTGSLYSTEYCNVLKYWDIINVPFVGNAKLILFRCPKNKVHYRLIMMCLIIGTPKTLIFHLGQMEN